MSNPLIISQERQVEARTREFILPTRFIGTFVIGDTTPSVQNCERWIAANVAPVSITNFHNGQPGQSIKIRGDGQTTIKNNSTIATNTAADKLLLANQVYEFTLFGTVWTENAGSSGSIFTTPFGYGVGVGGSATQSPNRGSTVTLNKICGQITTSAAFMSTGDIIQFQLSNTTIVLTDIIVINLGTTFCVLLDSYVLAANAAIIQYQWLGAPGGPGAFPITFAIIKSVIT